MQEYTEWLQLRNVTIENVRIACALVDWREDTGSGACHRYALYTKHIQEVGSAVTGSVSVVSVCFRVCAFSFVLPRGSDVLVPSLQLCPCRSTRRVCDVLLCN